MASYSDRDNHNDSVHQNNEGNSSEQTRSRIQQPQDPSSKSYPRDEGALRERGAGSHSLGRRPLEIQQIQEQSVETEEHALPLSTSPKDLSNPNQRHLSQGKSSASAERGGKGYQKQTEKPQALAIEERKQHHMPSEREEQKGGYYNEEDYLDDGDDGENAGGDSERVGHRFEDQRVRNTGYPPGRGSEDPSEGREFKQEERPESEDEENLEDNTFAPVQSIPVTKHDHRINNPLGRDAEITFEEEKGHSRGSHIPRDHEIGVVEDDNDEYSEPVLEHPDEIDHENERLPTNEAVNRIDLGGRGSLEEKKESLSFGRGLEEIRRSFYSNPDNTQQGVRQSLDNVN